MAAISPADLQSVAQAIEIQRRRAEAATALLVQHVDAAAACVADGHRNVAAWARATNNWSPAVSSP